MAQSSRRRPGTKSPRQITPIDAMEHRRSVLAAGMRRAAEMEGRPGVELPAEGMNPGFENRLAQAQWRDPLLLLMAAVSGSDGSVERALSLSRRELAIDVARRERDRLCRGVKDSVVRSLLVHLYGCITMCGGLNREMAVRIAEGELSALHKSYPGGAGQAIEDLCNRLGASDVLPGMTPDLLAEAILLAVFGERDLVGEQVIERLAPLASERVAATLIHLVQDFGHVEAGRKTNPQTIGWAERALGWFRTLVRAGESDIRILVNIEGALPGGTLTLRSIAEEVTAILVSRLRETAYVKEEMGQAWLARWLNNLSIRQGALGLRESALESVQESVSHYRDLVELDREAFLPDLAMSLNNLSNGQSALGLRESALESTKESVAIRRELVGRNREGFLPDLAGSLNALSNGESDMGLRESALESIQESVSHYRDLVELDREAFLPDLASSLSALGDRLAQLGRIEEAREEAVTALRLLAPFFLRYAKAFQKLALITARDYVVRSKELQLEPEWVVLEPYRSLWEPHEDGEEGREGGGDG